MDFIRLPVEIGSKIFNYLDTKTQINVYNSCDELRNYFRSWCHLRKVDLSRSVLGTVRTLNEQLLLDIGQYIVELNLSGVPDLTVANLKYHITRFVVLKSLDVTFTNINLGDIAEICPKTLKSLGINFDYDDRIIEKSKEVFKQRQFETIHFAVMDFNSISSPLIFLKDVNCVKDLKLTVSDSYEVLLHQLNNFSSFTIGHEIDINFSKLTLIARKCAVSHKMSRELDGLRRLNFKQLEYIFLMYSEEIVIHVSPLLARRFDSHCSDVKVTVSTYVPLNFMLDGNIVFKAWNKESTTFDERFFKQLQLELKDYFPTYFCCHLYQTMKIINAPSSWFCFDKGDNFDKINNLLDKITITEFCRRDSMVKRFHKPISIPKTGNSLQHLTYLRLNSVPIRKQFFVLLFQNCPKLVTLNISMETLSAVQSYTQSLSKSIHLAQLKNFMLTSENVQFAVIFGILNRCPSLENIHIGEYEREVCNNDVDVRNIVELVKRCVNLYSLFIESDMSAEVLTMVKAPLRATAQSLKRHHLCIEVCQSNWGWNPFADVFSPSPLHIFN